MDAFLCQQAYREIKAISFLSGQKPQAGLLFGHLRGPRIFIERVWPLPEDFKQIEKLWRQLEENFESQIIGFFAYHPLPRLLRSIFQPFAYGKIFIEVKSKKGNLLSLKCSLIEFSHSFRLFPCPLQIEFGEEE